MDQKNILESYIVELLHIDNGNANKLINLACLPKETFLISPSDGLDTKGYARYFFENILKKHFGKLGTTVLRKSKNGEQLIGPGQNVVEWSDYSGLSDPADLSRFISLVSRSTVSKGNNPLFLSIGAVKWNIKTLDNELTQIVSPLIIFPIKLIISGETQPIAIEFVEDDVTFNDCFYYKMRECLGVEISSQFPQPPLTDKKTIDIDSLDLTAYFAQVEKFIENAQKPNGKDSAPFELVQDLIAVARYEHEDMCMYYDICRNKEAILDHPVVKKVFGEDVTQINHISEVPPKFVKPFDSVQEEIVRRALGGENIKIQGPPGTGKTQTIANLIAALMGENKQVLFISRKLSALSEVYNKLPKPLQNFILRLTAESEKDIAVENPAMIHLKLRKRFNLTASEILDNDETEQTLKIKAEVLNKKKNEILLKLEKYCNFMFENKVFLGSSFYQILDSYCKIFDCEPIEFSECTQLLTVSLANYEEAKLSVANAALEYDNLTENNTHLVVQCPWFNVKEDIAYNTALAQAKELKENKIKLIISALKPLVEVEPTLADFSMYDFIQLSKMRVLTQQIESFLDFTDVELLSNKILELSKNISSYREEIKRYQVECPLAFSDKFDRYFFESDKKLAGIRLASLQHVAELTQKFFIEKDGELADRISLQLLIKNLKDYSDVCNYATEQKNIFCKVFNFDTANPQMLAKAFKLFHKMIQQNCTTIPSWNIFASKMMKNLKNLSASPQYIKEAEVFAAVEAYSHFNSAQHTMALKKDAISELLRTDLSFDNINELLEVCTKGEFFDFKQLVTAVHLSWNAVFDVVKSLQHSVPLQWNIQKLSNMMTYALKNKEIEKQIVDIKANYAAVIKIIQNEKTKEIDFEKLEVLANEIKVLAKIIKRCKADMPKDAPKEKLHDSVISILNNAYQLLTLKDLTQPLAEMTSFVQKYMENSIYEDLTKIRLKELQIFYAEIDDQNKWATMIRFQKILKAAKVNIQGFFRPFVLGFRKDNLKYSFRDIFEHSVQAMLIKVVKNINQNEMLDGSTVEGMLHDFKTTEDELLDTNTKIIALERLPFGDKNAEKFRFLQNEQIPFKVCRLMFKVHANAILSLINCFIMSPSAVSVLFRDEKFANFDVVIVDEGSQMAPQYLLPALYRGKQCIIMGDEYQMPPIRHFVRKNATQNTNEDGYEAIRSSLDIVGRSGSGAFTSITLRSHYRSLTESLIAFSQRYYDQMLTFPSVVPYNDDRGIHDIFLSDGSQEGGVNEKEVAQVLQVLEKHFKQNYQEVEGGIARLCQTVGVVVFGESQLKSLQEAIYKNKDLSTKISRVQQDFDGAPEKVFFLRTVEKVQGQEADHIILSLTYGRKNNDAVGSFGQLSEGELGEKIFNVAVSRAKQKMTVIHSVLPENLEGRQSIAYIQNFLQTVRDYSQNGRHKGFFAGEQDSSFVQNVANFIKELGVSPQRIIINFGATEKSFRIPLVILSKDLSKAELGIICETRPMVNKKPIQYIDFAIRYVNSLKERGWEECRVFIYDWVNNTEQAKQNLKNKILAKTSI